MTKTEKLINLGPFLYSYMGPNMGTPIYGPRVLSAKNISYIHTWELYMGVFFPCSPMCALFIIWGDLSYLPIFSYLGAVSFQILHFENFFNNLDILAFNYNACKKGCGSTSKC
jgi:hypothetical protein